MPGLIVRPALLLAIVGACLAFAAPAQAVPAVAGEFAMPGGATIGSDNEIVEGPDGNMWVTTQGVPGVARFTPDGTATFFGLTDPAFGITVGPDGNLWASQNAGIAKIPPANPAAKVETPVGGGFSGGRGIAVGADGNLWMIGTSRLARISPANPLTQDVNVITTTNPKGMTAGTDGLLWYADQANIVSATPTDTPTLTPYAVGGGAQDVAAGPSGQVAYANPVTSPHTVGRIVTGQAPFITELTTSDPFGITFGQDGAYWVARSSTNDLLRLTTDGQTSMLTGFAPTANVGPRKIATGPGNTLWVTLETNNKVAKVTGVDPPVVDPGPDPPGAAPETTIDKSPKKVKAKGKKGKAKFEFSSATAGATFECSLAKAKKKKPKRAAFAACKSPKTYKLKPGKYTFKVRAKVGDIVDATAATKKFKVVAGG